MSDSQRALPSLLVLAALALFAGCDDDDFDPITQINAPRILAVVTEPTVLAIDGQVTLDAITVDRDGLRSGFSVDTPVRPVNAIRMRACTPWKFFSDPSIGCTGADSLDLTPDADGRFAMTTRQLVEAFPPPMGGGETPEENLTLLRAALASGVELRIPVLAEVDVDGETLVARRDVWIEQEVGDLKNPGVAEFRFDGAPRQTLRSGQRYTLTITFDRDSLDLSSNDDGDRPPRLEDIDCNFYSPTGELAEREADAERNGPDDIPETEENAYTPGEPGFTWIYIVATDETGGMTFARAGVTVE